MRRIGVFTSGGDAPGMNACLRAVVRTAAGCGIEVMGIQDGYTGFMNRKAFPLGPRAVSNIIQRGGTIMGTSRCPDFYSEAGRRKGYDFIETLDLEGLVAIGGDGTFRGAHLLSEEFGLPVVGIPGTIDNDVFGSDFTIGFDTAVNTALGAIDKIRDTAASHSRIFFVEVMGRSAGFIALETALSCGAEEVVIPEENCDVATISRRILEGVERGKKSSIIIVAEGDELGGAAELAGKIELPGDFEVRVSILGHVQRGGSPSYRDRVLAGRLGWAAVTALRDGRSDVMAGEIAGELHFTPLEETWTRRKAINPERLRLARDLTT